MTTVGENRKRYAAEVEARPSRFRDPEGYRAWAARADRWATNNGHICFSGCRCGGRGRS